VLGILRRLESKEDAACPAPPSSPISSLQSAHELTARSLEVAAGFAPKAPAPTAVIEGTFNLASQILALQKTYALAAVETFSAPAKAANCAKSE